MAVPLKEMFCATKFALVVSVRFSLLDPTVVGVKSMGSVQRAPAGSEVVEVQTLGTELSRGKSAATPNPLKVNVAFPIFSTVTDCGLSLLFTPTAVKR